MGIEMSGVQANDKIGRVRMLPRDFVHVNGLDLLYNSQKSFYCSTMIYVLLLGWLARKCVWSFGAEKCP